MVIIFSGMTEMGGNTVDRRNPPIDRRLILFRDDLETTVMPRLGYATSVMSFYGGEPEPVPCLSCSCKI